MKFINPRSSNIDNINISIRCPFCHQNGMFELIGKAVLVDNDCYSEGCYAGNFKCPNSACDAHVFIIYKEGYTSPKTSIISYPNEIVDFDNIEIPEEIANTFEEALKCHANNLFTSSAIMIRRTLEELCSEKEAKGNNLKKRIEDLRGKVMLPNALMDGLDDLRLLGNDATHVKSRNYKNIGQTEVELAIDVTKEILKSVYQLNSLINRFSDLKKS